MLVFDDSFEHEVIHESKEQRTVLIIDFHHPDLPQVKYDDDVSKVMTGYGIIYFYIHVKCKFVNKMMISRRGDSGGLITLK